MTEPTCRWPGCLRSGDGTVSQDGGRTWDCWHHLTDEFLPRVEFGVRGVCVQCGQICATWLVRWPAQPDMCLHERCRRAWAFAEAGGTGPLELAGPESRLLGAYARRSSG